MLDIYACFIGIFLLFMPDGRNAWLNKPKDRELFNRIGHDIVADAVRKAGTVSELKAEFANYKTFAIGETIFIIRTKLADMIRLYMRGLQKQNSWAYTDLVRNLTYMQKMAGQMYIFQDEVLRYDLEIEHDNNPQNISRVFPGTNCQAAGTMYIPEPVMNPYRQTLNARRQNIIKTYTPKPMDIRNYVADALKPTVMNGLRPWPKTRNPDVEIMDIAPDLWL